MVKKHLFKDVTIVLVLSILSLVFWQIEIITRFGWVGTSWLHQWYLSQFIMLFFTSLAYTVPIYRKMTGKSRSKFVSLTVLIVALLSFSFYFSGIFSWDLWQEIVDQAYPVWFILLVFSALSFVLGIIVLLSTSILHRVRLWQIILWPFFLLFPTWITFAVCTGSSKFDYNLELILDLQKNGILNFLLVFSFGFAGVITANYLLNKHNLKKNKPSHILD